MRYYSIVSIRFAAIVSKYIARKNVIIVAVRYVEGISHIMRNSQKFHWLWYWMRMMKIPLRIPIWYTRYAIYICFSLFRLLILLFLFLFFCKSFYVHNKYYLVSCICWALIALAALVIRSCFHWRLPAWVCVCARGVFVFVFVLEELLVSPLARENLAKLLQQK